MTYNLKNGSIKIDLIQHSTRADILKISELFVTKNDLETILMILLPKQINYKALLFVL